MPQLDRRSSATTTGGALGIFALTVASSLKARGLRRTLLFVGLGLGIPLAGEHYAVNRRRILRHHLQPQRGGIPLAIAVGWYTIGYNTFVMVESLARRLAPTEASRLALLPLATAVTATSFDLLLDVALLEQGFWEWSTDGAYAATVAGPNGRHGVPLENYAGWLVLTGSVTALYLVLGDEHAVAQPAAASVSAGRQAALRLLPTYLAALGWELRRRRWGTVAASALFHLVLALSLWGAGRAE